MEKALVENNFEIILFACQQIDVWYQKNLSDILQNYYVSDTEREVHQENCKIIKNITNDFEENKEQYIEYFSALSRASKSTKRNSNKDEIFRLFDRFHQVVIQLRERYGNRETIDVNDEYDIQDLLHTLLTIYYDDIRREEWTPSYAGACSRQDFLLKTEQVVIETKKTRKGLGNRELADELIIDIARYKTHPDCKTLICFIYDPENRIRNPRGFESDLSKKEDGFEIIVFIRP